MSNEDFKVMRCEDGQFTCDVLVPKSIKEGDRYNAPKYWGDWDDIASGDIDTEWRTEIVIEDGECWPVNPLADKLPLT